MSFQKRNIVKPGESAVPLYGPVKPVPTSTTTELDDFLNKFVSFLAGMEIYGGLTVYDWMNVFCYTIFNAGVSIIGGLAVDTIDASGAVKGLTLEASVADGTAPLIITSTTKVANLNVDRLDDLDSAAFLQHSLATAVNDFLIASGNGAFAKQTLAETLTTLGKAAASGLASLDASSLVVQNPANATATPTASKIPIADGSGKLNDWVDASGGSMTYKEIVATGQSAGELNLSGVTWGISKAWIDSFTVSIASGDVSDYDIEIYEDDTFAGDPRYKVESALTDWEDETEWSYVDRDDTDEVHLKIIENTGTGTYNITIRGVELV